MAGSLGSTLVGLSVTVRRYQRKRMVLAVRMAVRSLVVDWGMR
ncbi:hypothetical protein [Micromonospora sp. AKA38]|nr:hypothetical protein [Micromonospora sp. AKA38]